MKLHTLKPAKGSVKKVKRIGRGTGSGNGTTAGKGYKGQQARIGYQSSFKEVGQMPMYRRLPKFGFKNTLREEYKIVNLDVISEYMKKGVLKQDISIDDMVSKKIIGSRDKVKLLGRGEGIKVNIEVNSVSATAKEKIEKSGGKVTVI